MPGGVEITVKIEDKEVREVLSRFQSRLGNLNPAMKIIGEVVRKSVWENFRQGGRPAKWEPNAPATLKRKKGTAVLINKGVSGGLMGSITSQASKDSVTVGTNKRYAAIHQFGGPAGRRSKRVTIPARPYLMVQDEDWVEIKQVLADYLTGLK